MPTDLAGLGNPGPILVTVPVAGGTTLASPFSKCLCELSTFAALTCLALAFLSALVVSLGPTFAFTFVAQLPLP